MKHIHFIGIGGISMSGIACMLKEQGYEGRDTFIELYSDLYHQAMTDFYDRYEGDQEKCHYFFQMTD